MYTHQEHKVQNDENDSTEAGDATHVYLYTFTQSDFCRWKVQFRYSPLAKHSQRTGFTSHWVPLFSRCNGKNSFYFTLSSSHKDNRKRTICIYIVTPDFFTLVDSSFVVIYMLTPKSVAVFFYVFFFYQGQLAAALNRACSIPHHKEKCHLQRQTQTNLKFYTVSELYRWPFVCQPSSWNQE